MSELLFKAGDDWNLSILNRCWEECQVVAKEDLKQTYYPAQIEVVSAAQMIEACSSHGMPVYYPHWSFGKDIVRSEADYYAGKTSLAYEVVINSNPCLAYLMEENTALTQLLVIAHASIGHSAVFKNNYLFKQHTDAEGMIPYLSFAKRFVLMCEERYGEAEVEAVLDACHALSLYGIDSVRKTRKTNAVDEERRAIERFQQQLQTYDAVWEKVGKPLVQAYTPEKDVGEDDLPEPAENILYFIEKHASIPAWKKELIRITRKIEEFFYPQRLTKVLNEGYASFCHHYILHRLYDKGLIDDGSLVEALAMHANVLYQRKHSSFNPYKLGFEIFTAIKRACEVGVEDPDDEPYIKHLVGTPWQDAVQEAMSQHSDETFILQYLTPSVAKKMGMFAIQDPGVYDDVLIVTEVARAESFRELRAKLAASYRMETYKPDICVKGHNAKKQLLILEHKVVNNRPLHAALTEEALIHLSYLWNGAVDLHTMLDNGDGETVVPVVISALEGELLMSAYDGVNESLF